MSRGERTYAAAVCAWLFLALALPDWKLGTALMGGSPGSLSQGANFYYSELGVLPLFAWALAVFRGRIASWVWLFSGVWTLLMAVAFVSGIFHGSHPRNALAEMRPVLLALDLVVLMAVIPQRRSSLRGAFFLGWAAWVLGTFVSFALDPSAAYAPNIVPVPVPAVDHNLHRLMLSALIGMALMLGKGTRSKTAWAVVLIAWALVWLSYLRALWMAWPLAVALGSLWLARQGQAKLAGRFLVSQALAALAALLLLLAAMHALAPDGEFLLKFRIYRSLQAAHLLAPLPERIQIEGDQSKALKDLAAQGGLFRNPSDNGRAPSAAEANRSDPSLSERALMLREAERAFEESPWFGKGLGHLFSYEIYPGNPALMRDPHNGYAWWLAKSGLFGMALLLGLLLWGLSSLSRGSGQPIVLRTAQVCVFGLFLMLEFFQAGLLNADVALALASALALLRGDEA